MQGRRGWGFLAVWCALFAGLVWVQSVRAQTLCGYMACHQWIADSTPTSCGEGPDGYLRECECRPDDAVPPQPGRVEAWRRVFYHNANPQYWGSWQYQGAFGPCNCEARPTIPAGSMVSLNQAGKKCVNGCAYKPVGPGICVGTPNNPTAPQICDVNLVPNGDACDPFEDPADPPPGPICEETPWAETCLTPLIPPPPLIPEICATRNGQDLGCAAPGDPCSGDGVKGHLCVGDPPEQAPEPDPPPPPDETPPEDEPSPEICMYHAGGETCIEIDIDVYGPDGPPPETDGPPQTCPDGSQAVGGQCPAQGGCPDGTTPVNGMCNTDSTEPDDDGSGTQTCPDNYTLINGRCMGNCDDGSIPLNGQCPAGPGDGEDGWCPNGSRPVNGMCDVGSECNPATDPDQCEGPPDGNAGGGQTCAAPPYCSGDPILCQSLNQQWQTRCAAERIEETFNPDAPTEGDYGETPASGSWWGEDNNDGGFSDIDDGGFLGGGRQCPTLPTVTFMDRSWNMGDWIPCSILGILATLILLGGYAQAAYILGRG